MTDLAVALTETITIADDALQPRVERRITRLRLVNITGTSTTLRDVSAGVILLPLAMTASPSPFSELSKDPKSP